MRAVAAAQPVTQVRVARTCQERGAPRVDLCYDIKTFRHELPVFTQDRHNLAPDRADRALFIIVEKILKVESKIFETKNHPGFDTEGTMFINNRVYTRATDFLDRGNNQGHTDHAISGKLRPDGKDNQVVLARAFPGWVQGAV